MAIPYTPDAQAALRYARQTAAAENSAFVGTAHLLSALLCTSPSHMTTAARLLSDSGLSVSAFAKSPVIIKPTSGIAETPLFQKVCRDAEDAAYSYPIPSPQTCAVGTVHLLFALLSQKESVAAHTIAAQNVQLHVLYGDVLSYLAGFSHNAASGTGDGDVLSLYTQDFTALARQGVFSPCIGREKEIGRLCTILLRKQKCNPCLLGDAGVGKTAIAEGLADAVVRGHVPDALRNIRILSLNTAAFIGGTKYRGEFEERFHTLLSACEKDRNTVLFLDELHTLMGMGAAEGALDAANLLKPALSRGNIRIIGATTDAEYERTLARDDALARRFQIVRIEEPDFRQTLSILRGVAPVYAKHHNVSIPDSSLLAAVSLSAQYLPNRRQPDKALDLLDEACANVQMRFADESGVRNRRMRLFSGRLDGMETETPPENRNLSVPSVSENDIRAALSESTGIPTEENTPPEVSWDNTDSAIPQAVSVLYREHRQKNRPLSLLFRGTEANGDRQTDTAKRIALTVFGNEKRFVFFPLSHTTDRTSLFRLFFDTVQTDTVVPLPVLLKREAALVLFFSYAEAVHPDFFTFFEELLLNRGHTGINGANTDYRNCIVILSVSENTGNTPVGFTRSDEKNTNGFPSVFPRDFSARFDKAFVFPNDR